MCSEKVPTATSTNYFLIEIIWKWIQNANGFFTAVLSLNFNRVHRLLLSHSQLIPVNGILILFTEVGWSVVQAPYNCRLFSWYKVSSRNVIVRVQLKLTHLWNFSFISTQVKLSCQFFYVPSTYYVCSIKLKILTSEMKKIALYIRKTKTLWWIVPAQVISELQ